MKSYTYSEEINSEAFLQAMMSNLQFGHVDVIASLK